jgi:MOSC domain-containing protein YiiM
VKVVSLNVGRPREVEWHGRTVRTSIWKEPAAGRRRVERLNVEGDEQADLSVHGGEDKAVYAYPSEHYAVWAKELPGAALPWGAFGENLTTEGLLEDGVRIGDRLRVGTAELQVTQPRLPCYKLGLRFGRDDMVKRFLASGRSGFYLAVRAAGEVEAGDAIVLAAADPHGVTVAQVAGLIAEEGGDPDLLRRAAALPALPEAWRDHLRQRITVSRRGSRA